MGAADEGCGWGLRTGGPTISGVGSLPHGIRGLEALGQAGITSSVGIESTRQDSRIGGRLRVWIVARLVGRPRSLGGIHGAGARVTLPADSR